MTGCLLAIAALVASACGALIARRNGRVASGIAACGVVGAAALALPGALAVLAGEAPSEVVLPWAAPIDELRFGLDPLSAFFVVPLAVLGAICAVYGAFYLDDQRTRRLLAVPACFYNLLVAAMLVVLLARDAIGFVIAWELMTLASYVLVTFDHAQSEVRRAGWVYLVASHLGVAAILSMFLLLGTRGFSFEALAAGGAAAGAAATVAGVLGFLGFGVKAGIVPLHVWLPEAHASAPSHVSALMSGVLIKLGLYGILRTSTFVGDAVPWGALLLGVGVVSAVVGIALALYQRDIKRALAYSSVENIGVASIGFGVGFWAMSAGEPALATLGFCGGLLHVWNHSIMKGLMFLGAGSVLHGAGTRDLEQMGGLLRRMPRTGALMILGTVAIAGLPPLNGFASEWLIYLGLARGGSRLETFVGLPLLFAVAVVATVGVMAVLCFVRLAGIALLGEPRGERAAHAHESPRGMVLPMALLAALAVAMPFAAPWLVDVLAQPLVALGVRAPRSAVAHDALVDLARVGGALWACSIAAFLVVRRLARRRRRESETWGCGYVAPSARMQYSGASFAEGIHRLLPGVLRARIQVPYRTELFPPPADLTANVDDPFTRAAYEPLLDRGARRFGQLRWVQRGLLHIYILYVVVAVVVTLAIVSVRDFWELP
jgi:hydrogenase-4 component B